MVTDLRLELASSWLAVAPAVWWTVLPSQPVWSCMLLVSELSQPENLVSHLQGKICHPLSTVKSLNVRRFFHLLI